MRPRLVYLVTAALAIASSLAVGCGSDEVESADSYLTCKAGTFRLEGTIDGTPVDITQPSDTGGFAQTDGGEFGSLDNTRDRSIGTDLKLTWERGIDHGDSTDATGTLLIRSGPFAGETFCLGDGTPSGPRMTASCSST